jgi:hypothetical protein
MDMARYQKEYDELWKGVWGPEEAVDKSPAMSHLDALKQVGLMSGYRAKEILSALFYESDEFHKEYTEKYGNGEAVMAALGLGARRNKDLMLRLIEFNPRAYLYVHPSINDADFRRAAVKANKSVLLLLSEEQRKEPDLMWQYYESGNRKNAPSRDIDPRELFSLDEYSRRYERWIMGAKDEAPLRVWTLREHDAEFMKMAEKVNPEMAEQYLAAKRDIILKVIAMGVWCVYEAPSGALDERYRLPLFGEVEKYYPELLDTKAELIEYRKKRVDALISEAFDCTTDKIKWREKTPEKDDRREWLRRKLLEWPETREAAVRAITTNLRMTPKHSLEYAIDQASVYAQVAKNALVRFKGMTEQDAISFIRSSTYDEIEALIGIRKPLSNAILAIGQSLGVSKDRVANFEYGYVFDSRDKYGEDCRDSMFYGIRNALYRCPNEEYRIDQAIMDAMDAIREARELQGQNTTIGNRPIVEIIRDDLVFAGPIFKSLGMDVDGRSLTRHYEKIISQAAANQEREERKSIEEMVEFIVQNKEVALEVIKNNPQLAENVERALLELQQNKESQVERTDPTDGPNGLETPSGR